MASASPNQPTTAAESRRSLTIFVTTLWGTTATLQGLTAASTIQSLKEAFAREEAVRGREVRDPASLRVVFAGRLWDDAQTIGECRISNESTVRILQYRPGAAASSAALAVRDAASDAGTADAAASTTSSSSAASRG